VKAVLGVADWADRDDDTDVITLRTQRLHGTTEVRGALVYRQLALREETLRTLLAVVHYLTRLVEDVDVVGAEREDGCAGSVMVGEVALDGVEDARRIIHDTKGVDRGAKLILHEQPAYVVSKAGAHEEHALHGRDAERGLLYDDGSLELHIIQQFSP
jgi:hypothetical protein